MKELTCQGANVAMFSGSGWVCNRNNWHFALTYLTNLHTMSYFSLVVSANKRQKDRVGTLGHETRVLHAHNITIAVYSYEIQKLYRLLP